MHPQPVLFSWCERPSFTKVWQVRFWIITVSSCLCSLSLSCSITRLGPLTWGGLNCQKSEGCDKHVRAVSGIRTCSFCVRSRILDVAFVSSWRVTDEIHESYSRIQQDGRWRLSCPCAYRSTKPWRMGGWRWVVSFTPRPLYSWGKNRRYPLNRKLGGSQSRSGRYGEERNPCLYRESNPGGPARSLVTVLTELPRLPKERLCSMELVS